jgi:hypothetical protein
VKSSPVYFYVQRSADYNETIIPIPFDIEQLNVGGAMNLQTGKFTAPRTGKYFFSFLGLSGFDPSLSSTTQYSYIQLFKNGAAIANSYADEIGAGYKYEAHSLPSTLNLQNGDQIWLQITGMTPGVFLRGGSYTHFNGFLMEEEISQSLNVL